LNAAIDRADREDTMSGILRIGILGAARVAPNAIIKPARDNTETEVVAVAARDPQRAKDFADKHGVPRIVGSYADLLADREVDAVYNPLPNGLHGRWTLAALEAGKHVLCEKPFTANADEARTVAKAAKESGLVAMEAVHYRYHPLARRMREIVASDELGPIRHVEASFCFPLLNGGDIRYNRELAGGALMDAGCYAVHIVRMLADAEPEVVAVKAKLRNLDVDRAVTAELRFPSGATGVVRCSMLGARVFQISAKAVGARGEMRVINPLAPHMYHRLSVRGADGRRVERLTRRPSYAFQLDAFAGAALRGEPLLTPLSDSIANMSVIDSIYRAAKLEPRRPTAKIG
jgi:predicted dehydrogenase